MPEPFLEVLVQDVGEEPTLTALCAGYENGDWRCDALAHHLFEWLPEFALTWRERQEFSDATSVALLRRAAAVVYATDKYERRGEFGELILHAIVRQVFGSEPAISKLYYKSSANETVKGFDSVHVVPANDTLELWLGEAKFYNNYRAAARAVVEELADHVEHDYLRGEFLLITNKIDPGWPYAERLSRLLHPNTSLDEVFDAIRVPVMITYDSSVIPEHAARTDEYRAAFEKEVRAHHFDFRNRSLPDKVSINLVLLPLSTKERLVTAMDDILKAWHSI
jgi:hypothetical protein